MNRPIQSRELIDTDYKLAEGAAWFDVKGFAIRIHSTDEGVIADVFDSKVLARDGADAGLIASTFAYDNELEEVA